MNNKTIYLISVISISIGVLTTLAVVYLGKRLWSYNLERTAAIYGSVTGTVSCGLLLLRIVDPEFKTPVAIDIALMNIFSIPGNALSIISSISLKIFIRGSIF